MFTVTCVCNCGEKLGESSPELSFTVTRLAITVEFLDRLDLEVDQEFLFFKRTVNKKSDLDY